MLVFGVILLAAACGGGGGSGSSGSSSSGDTGLTALLFEADDGSVGIEPWVSDGTEDGTEVLKNIHGSGGDSDPKSFTRVNDTIIFAATTSADGTELWKTDGTRDGTELLKDINPGADDGVASGPSGPSIAVVGDHAYFAGDDPNQGGNELWRTDGTTSGTERVSDIRSGSASSTPRNLVAYDGRVFFTADDGTHDEQLWVSDGTDAGTRMLKEINPNGVAFPRAFTVSGGKLFFVADDGTHGRELWVSEGTAASTELVEDIYGGGDHAFVSFPVLAKFGQGVAFVAKDGTHGPEIWLSEGTPTSTTLLKDIDGAASGSLQWDWAPFGHDGQLYFAADDGSGTGVEPWVSDGTTAGTQRIQDINTGGDSSTSSFPGTFTVFDGAVYFAAGNGSDGVEPWRTDGTAANTEMVSDVNPGSDSSAPLAMEVFQDQLYFSADVGTGRELWRTDGTDAGTERFKIPNLGGDGKVRGLTAFE